MTKKKIIEDSLWNTWWFPLAILIGVFLIGCLAGYFTQPPLETVCQPIITSNSNDCRILLHVNDSVSEELVFPSSDSEYAFKWSIPANKSYRLEHWCTEGVEND